MTFRPLSVVLLIVFATTATLGQAPQRTEPTFRVHVDAVEFDAFIHVEARSNIGARPVVSRDILIRVR